MVLGWLGGPVYTDFDILSGNIPGSSGLVAGLLLSSGWILWFTSLSAARNRSRLSCLSRSRSLSRSNSLSRSILSRSCLSCLSLSLLSCSSLSRWRCLSLSLSLSFSRCSLSCSRSLSRCRSRSRSLSASSLSLLNSSSFFGLENKRFDEYDFKLQYKFLRKDFRI